MDALSDSATTGGAYGVCQYYPPESVISMQSVSVRRGLRATLVGAASLLLIVPFSHSAEATTPAPVADQTAGVTADPGGTTLHVFYQADGTQHLINKVAGSGFQDLGGTLTSGAAGLNMQTDGNNWVFVRGVSGAVYFRQEDVAGNGWADWRSLGGTIIGTPTASCLAGPDAVPIVYVRGTNNNLYRHEVTAGAGWESLGGQLASDPSAVPAVSATTPAVEDVFVLGTNGAIYEWIGGQFHKINATTDTAPAALRFADGRTWLFTRSVADGSLLLSTRSSDSAAWSAARNLGGTLASAPTVTLMNGQVNVVIGSPNGQLYRGRFVGTSLVWSALP